MKMFTYFTAFVLSFFAATASAQYSYEPSVKSMVRTDKNSRPAPGMMCSTVREEGTFDESQYVAFDLSLMTIQFVKKCMSTLPEKFTSKKIDVVSYPVLEFRVSEASGLICSYSKTSITSFPELRIRFISINILKQADIDRCFENAKNGPNNVRIGPTSNI